MAEREKTIKVKYVGPADVVNHEVAMAIEDDADRSDVLVPGKTYDLPEELAHRLVLSNENWQLPTKAATEDLRAKAIDKASTEDAAIDASSTAVENKAGLTPGASEEE